MTWAASWLYKATKAGSYWKYVQKGIHYLESSFLHDNPFVGGCTTEFGWDTKQAGINVLVSQWAMTDSSIANPFIPYVDQFVCTIFPQSPSKSVSYSPGTF